MSRPEGRVVCTRCLRPVQGTRSTLYYERICDGPDGACGGPWATFRETPKEREEREERDYEALDA